MHTSRLHRKYLASCMFMFIHLFIFLTMDRKRRKLQIWECYLVMRGEEEGQLGEKWCDCIFIKSKVTKTNKQKTPWSPILPFPGCLFPSNFTYCAPLIFYYWSPICLSIDFPPYYNVSFIPQGFVYLFIYSCIYLFISNIDVLTGFTSIWIKLESYERRAFNWKRLDIFLISK